VVTDVLETRKLTKRRPKPLRIALSQAKDGPMLDLRAGTIELAWHKVLKTNALFNLGAQTMCRPGTGFLIATVEWARSELETAVGFGSVVETDGCCCRRFKRGRLNF
jgi:hypothetical protein